MKSRRWYIYRFLRSLIIAAGNSWLWDKRNYLKPMKLFIFISEIASALIEYRSSVRRLSRSPIPLPKRPKQIVKRRIHAVRKDSTNNLPIYDEKWQQYVNWLDVMHSPLSDV